MGSPLPLRDVATCAFGVDLTEVAVHPFLLGQLGHLCGGSRRVYRDADTGRPAVLPERPNADDDLFAWLDLKGAAYLRIVGRAPHHTVACRVFSGAVSPAGPVHP